jgi:hypothetical protein
MKKKFDAVAFQRKARQKLSREFIKDRKTFLQKLREKHISNSPTKV